MSFVKTILHATTFDNVKSVAAVDNLLFKRVDISGA